jgi:O-antigen/teichoic acid export membrane protein
MTAVPAAETEKGSILQRLAKLSLAYATGDVLAMGINFLLTPLYFAFLAPEQLGALNLLLALSTFLKIFFRLGLDSAFIRIFYDVKPEDRKRFAGTVAIFSAAFSAAVFALAWLLATPLSIAVFDEAGHESWIRLAAADILASSFVFVPMSLLRIEGRAALMSSYSLARHFLNTALKVGLVVAGHGVTGALISDIAASALLALLLLSELRSRAVLAFDIGPLREALRFGLPKVPHGVLFQCLNLADRRILLEFVSLAQVGVYAVGNNFAGAMKFPLSAFEPAWQPFVFESAKKPEGARDIALVATRVAIVFVAIALGLSLVLPDVLLLMSRNHPEYHGAGPLIPVVILGFLFQGFFFLSSVGISITKHARYYPMITALSAAVNIALNFLFIPRFGIMASAWATAAGWAITAYAGATVSNRLYPLSIGWPRIAAALAAAVVTFAAADWIGPGLGQALIRVAAASGFALFAWLVVYDADDRRELKKVVGL